MPKIDPKDFATECAAEGLLVGLNPHYLAAIAQFRSGMSDDNDGARMGPFRITQAIWDANLSGSDLDLTALESTDISKWFLQCLFVAMEGIRAQNRCIDRLGRYPSVIELYAEHWPDDPAPAIADLQAALDATAADIDVAVENELGQPLPDTVTILTPATPTQLPVPDPVGPAVSKAEQLFLSKSQRVMDKLIAEFGLQDYQAAGILGNIGHECNGFRTMQEVRKPGARGLGGLGWAQWTGQRRTNFVNFCAKNGFDTSSDAGNFAFLQLELGTTPFSKAVLALKPTSNLSQAVRAFEQNFEMAAANAKFYDRRERWGSLALGAFRTTPQIPPPVLKLLDPELMSVTVLKVASGGSTYWLIDQNTHRGGQFLIKQTGNTAVILAQDTSVFPLPPGVTLPPDVALAFKEEFTENQNIGQKPQSGGTTDGEVANLIFRQALASDGTLITRNVAHTKNGHLACAWAVNEVVRLATGRLIDSSPGGHFSTTELNKTLAKKHRRLTETELMPGAVVISPTNASAIGHVGIVGAIAAGLSSTKIYSNSSSAGVFRYRGNFYTMTRWQTEMQRRGLPTLFYQITKAGLDT